MTEVERQIVRILESGFIVIETDVPLGAETALIEGGLNLDSVNLLELLVRVEEGFGIMIEDEDINAELVATLGSLASFVRRKLDARAPAGHSRPA